MKRLSAHLPALPVLLMALWGSFVFAQAENTPQPGATYQATFETEQPWATVGQAGLDSKDAFQGKQALLLTRAGADLNKTTGTTSALGPLFPVAPGTWEVKLACKTELYSPDNSYNGTVTIQFLDAEGQPAGQATVAEPFGRTPWHNIQKRITVPGGAVSARFQAQIFKSSGKFWIDDISAVFVASRDKSDRVERLVFTTGQLGNLLYPGDSRAVKLYVRATEPLPEEQLTVTCTLRDYWGAELAPSFTARLAQTGKDARFVHYETTADLGPFPLELGKYYELHGRIERPGTHPFTNYTSFAILPEAAANEYPPEQIPFTSRTWDQRFAESPKLTKRLGIRICNVWGRMNSDPQKLEAPQIELVHELGLGVLTSSPAQAVESRAEDWEKLLENDGEKIRRGVRNFFAKYGSNKPILVNLGNEPHSRGDEINHDIEAYRIVYTEIKKIDPSIFVVGSSMGPEEEYFKRGLGQWCDAYDFHSYEDPESVRDTLTKTYPALFKKYGHPKPVWCTEIGMNSQGMTRQAVAGLVYKKFANFFAGGGANVSWFGLFYPDPDAKKADSFSSAHNVFDCRYSKYAPKLDAIAYYNSVNAICIKKFVEDKVYGKDLHAFLFRDSKGQALQICYKNKGREDVFLPLPGVDEVELIRIDGTRRKFNAGRKGITATISEDPFLLLYKDSGRGLADKLGAPAIELGKLPDSMVRGEAVTLEVLSGEGSTEPPSLTAPPLWKVSRTPAPEGSRKTTRFEVTSTESTEAREADFAVVVHGASGEPSGELSFRLPVRGGVSMQVLPTPDGTGSGAGVKLAFRNNRSTEQSAEWTATLIGEQELREGKFTNVGPCGARFALPLSGTVSMAGHAVAEVNLPLAGANLEKVYRVRATVKDAQGQFAVEERPVSAFYGVRKTPAPLTLDGTLTEEAWKNAPVRRLDKADQYLVVDKLQPNVGWKGPKDLSASLRYLWDDQYLYLGVEVTDDRSGKLFCDSELWMQDGLQLLVDPSRASSQKPGKYDYSIALGSKGPQAWCHLSADAGASTGEAREIRVTAKKAGDGTAAMTYEIAIPWARLAPFTPGVGHDLGLTLIVNEDDANGRNSFMTWFGNAHLKDVDTAADLILLDAAGKLSPDKL